MLSQTYSQRSVGNGAGLQQRGNPSGRSHQLSMPTMSQFGGMSETQPQVGNDDPPVTEGPTIDHSCLSSRHLN